MHWIEGVDGQGLSTGGNRVFLGGNSGYQAVNLAFLWGASRIVLLGYDMRRTGGRTHWHPDHPARLGNIGRYEDWAVRFAEMARDLVMAGVPVVNVTRSTALQCFEQASIDTVLGKMVDGKRKPALLVKGMHGLGDSLHQRAVVAELAQWREVWLETPWPCLFHDQPVRCILPESTLRTQKKNVAREAIAGQRAPRGAEVLRVAYRPARVRELGSFLGAMSDECGVAVGTFKLPIPQAWSEKAEALLSAWKPTKPLMIFRPLVERTEWGGCEARNPDAEAYVALAESVRDRFFLVSVADLEAGAEWMVAGINADVTCHRGELDVETLAALASKAVVFTAPGFALILAQAVGAPFIAVFGGHESARMYDRGEGCFIEPVEPCECFSRTHGCDKRIDVPTAIEQVQEFIESRLIKS